MTSIVVVLTVSLRCDIMQRGKTHGIPCTDEPNNVTDERLVFMTPEAAVNPQVAACYSPMPSGTFSAGCSSSMAMCPFVLPITGMLRCIFIARLTSQKNKVAMWIRTMTRWGMRLMRSMAIAVQPTPTMEHMTENSPR